MKTLINYSLLLVILVFVSFRNLEKKADIQEKGASDGRDLPGIVFNAMKLNDFDQVVNYIPGEAELEFLQKSASKKSRYLYDQTEAERIKAEAKLSFDKIVEEGVKMQINWSDAEITESGIEKTDSPDKRISKGWFIIQDRKENQMKVSFDVIRVKNKWFAFRGFNLEDKK